MPLSALPLFHQVAGQRVVVLGEGPAADAKRRLVERAGGTACGEPEAHHARLAFVAIDDPRRAEEAAARLRCKGLLVNVADRPGLCDFTVPSVLERDPVVIAVGTAGASAGLAKQIRLRFERLLPPSIGGLATALYGARETMRARWPDAARRRHALDAALAQGGPLDPFDANAADKVELWLEGDAPQHDSGPVAIVLTSDDPDDLTLRQARWLGEADTLLHDADVPEAILNRARADAVRGPPDGQPCGRTVIVRWRG